MIGKELDAAGAAGRAARARTGRRGRAPPLVEAERPRPDRRDRRRSTSTIHEGEVVGLAGLLGSGRTELARLLFGADRADTGTVRDRRRAGHAAHARAPRWPHGIAFCSENRRTEGLVADLTRAGEHHPGAAGRARLDPAAAPRAARTSWSTSTSRRCDIRPADPEHAGAQPQRRQPAEGAAGPLADHRAAAADPRRAHPRHRRRRQGGDPAAGRRALRRRAWRCCSSPPSWRRCCGSATRSRVLRDRHLVAELANDDDLDRRRAHARRSRAERPHDPDRRARRDRRALTRPRALFWPVADRWSCCSLLAQRRLHRRTSSRSRSGTGHLYGSLIDIAAVRRAADPGRARHDPGHRHRRHRPVGRLGRGHRRRAGLPAHQRPGRPEQRRRRAGRGRRSRSGWRCVLGAVERLPRRRASASSRSSPR